MRKHVAELGSPLTGLRYTFDDGSAGVPPGAVRLAGTVRMLSRGSALDDFRPRVLAPAGPVLVCMGQPNAYHFRKIPMGYALVTRVASPVTESTAVMMAGLTHFGTQAAGEFVTNFIYFHEALKNAPSDWRQRNMQVVLSARVLSGTVGPPHVVALHFCKAAQWAIRHRAEPGVPLMPSVPGLSRIQRLPPPHWCRIRSDCPNELKRCILTPADE